MLFIGRVYNAGCGVFIDILECGELEEEERRGVGEIFQM